MYLSAEKTLKTPPIWWWWWLWWVIWILNRLRGREKMKLNRVKIEKVNRSYFNSNFSAHLLNCQPVVDFTTVLRAAFMQTDHKSAKRHDIFRSNFCFRHSILTCKPADLRVYSNHAWHCRAGMYNIREPNVARGSF